MKNFIKHVSVWVFVVIAGVVSVYVAAQASSVSIEANIGSFVQYIGSLFVTSNGTPSGQPIVSIDADGLSLHDLTRENAGPGLVGVNTAGQVVMTRPLSYVTLPATSTVQQLANNHAYIVPYWDTRSETNVILPSTCIIGDQIEIYAMQLPLNMDTLGDMRIIAPYLEGDRYVGYGYADYNAFIEYESYTFYDKIGFASEYEWGVGPDYPFDRCEYVWDPDTSSGNSACGDGESPSGYGPRVIPPKKVSFLCVDDFKYLMQFDYMPINKEGGFYPVLPNSGYGDRFGSGFPNPYVYDN